VLLIRHQLASHVVLLRVVSAAQVVDRGVVVDTLVIFRQGDV
jgi:hypothetical protein